MTDTETRTVVVERDFAHSPEKLWHALTQPHLIEDWLMQNDFAPKIGHRFQLKGEWGGVLDCEVLEIAPNRQLAYSWNFANDDPAYALESVVTFTLNPSPQGTHLRVEQTGFRPDQKQAYGGAHAGWKQFLGNLDTLLGKLEAE
ncbi:MAG: polyketide cyclase [Pelagibacterium sp. SCN 64-44]|nr:MAG: polyketide cyclase [Pelagibacterium sp. SCN 64-44]